MRDVRKFVPTMPAVVLSLLVLGSAAAFAQKNFMILRAPRPDVKVQLAGVVQRDQHQIPLDEAVAVKSGEVMKWTISSVNEGNAPAQDYKAVGIIPSGTELVAGSVSADGSATVSYSIDNGKSFAAQPTVDQKQPDGSLKKVAAPISMYTQIRYEWADPLNQGNKLNAFYRVRLK